MISANDQLQQMINAMEPTQRYIDLLDASSVAKQFERAAEASGIGPFGDDVSTALARINKDHSFLTSMESIPEAMKNAANSFNLHGGLLESIGPAIDARLSIGKQVEELYNSQFQGFSQLVSEALPKLSGVAEIFRPVGSFAEFEVVGGFLADFADLELKMAENGDDEPESTDDGERRIVLLEELRQGIISVRGIPVRFLEFLKQYPHEALQSLTWQQLEELIAEICETKLGGEDIYLTRNSSKGDHGLDVVGSFRVHGIKTVFGIQCKKYAPHNKVEGSQVRELKGALSFSPHNATRGILCTTSDFRKQATDYFFQNVEVSGWRPEDIAAIVRGDHRLNNLIS